MRRCHRIEDEIQARGERRHLVRIARYDHFIRAERLGGFPLGFGCGERHHVRAHRVRELDPHMAQAADPDDAYSLSGPDFPVTQRRIRSDARIQQWRYCGASCASA